MNDEHSTRKYWIRTTLFSVLLFFVWLGYVYWYLDRFSVVTVNRALSLTAMTLIGISFALSGLCYFWDSICRKMVYRRYLGVIGFAYALMHGMLSGMLYVNPPWHSPVFVFYTQWNVFGVYINNSVAFIFGLIALIIFAAMTAISNNYAANLLGGVLWRKLLRWGYAAYFLTIAHFGIKEADVWSAWIRYPFSSPPPPSLLIFCLALMVFCLRVVMAITIWRRPNSTPNG